MTTPTAKKGMGGDEKKVFWASTTRSVQDTQVLHRARVGRVFPCWLNARDGMSARHVRLRTWPVVP